MIYPAKSIPAVNSQGKWTLSAKGGLCHSLAGGFDFDTERDGRYGVGISTEYRFLEPLSAGLAFTYNSFQGVWQGSMIPEDQSHYSTGWNWTSVSLFARFLWAPQNDASPYFTAGMGLYFPKVKDRWFLDPARVVTHTSYGRGQFGYHLGCGIQYSIKQKVFVFLEVPLTVVRTRDLEIQGHGFSEDTQYFNIFAGISFLL